MTTIIFYLALINAVCNLAIAIWEEYKGKTTKAIFYVLVAILNIIILMGLIE